MNQHTKFGVILTCNGKTLLSLEKGVTWYPLHLLSTILISVWKQIVEEQKWRQGIESGPMPLSKKERMVTWMGRVTGGGEWWGMWWHLKANSIIDWMSS